MTKLKIVHYSNRHRAKDTRIFDLHGYQQNLNGFKVVIFGIIDKASLVGGITLLPHKNGFLGALITCLKEHADIYVFHDPGLLYLAVILRLFKKKVFFDSHENYEEKIKTRLLNRYPLIGRFRFFLARLWWYYEKLLTNLLTGKIVADRTVLEKYMRNTILLPNVPGERFYSNIPQKNVVKNSFNLIYVGTLTFDRGIVETIEAIQLSKYYEQIKFHVIGDTKDESMQQLLSNSPNTIWHGRVDWIELKNHLVNADIGVVLLQPVDAYLYYPGENIVKLWEYMSIEIPIIIPNFPNLIQLNNEIGFGKCVDPTDIASIASLVDWMIENPEERQKMGVNGRNAVISKYNAEIMIQPLISKFLNVLGHD